jgi:hypothetical protein
VDSFQKYVAANWDNVVKFGKEAWNAALERASTWVNRASWFLGEQGRRFTEALAAIREMAPKKIDEAFDWVRRKLNEMLEWAKKRIGQRRTDVSSTPDKPVSPATAQVETPPTSATPTPTEAALPEVPTTSAAAPTATTATPAPTPGSATQPAIHGAEDVRFSSQAEYEAALGRVFPVQHLNVITRTVDDLGQFAAQQAVKDPRFVQAVQSRNWTLAGTLFHSAAAREARNLPATALPPGWTIQAERTIQAGAGGSRADILMHGPTGEIIEFDWKTTGRSALSSGARKEMTRHAGQITANIGGNLISQESRSWIDFVRPLMPGVSWP